MEQLVLTTNSPTVQYIRVARPFGIAEKWNLQRKNLPALGSPAPRRNVKVQLVPDSQSTK
jgi:hypothetical protein